MHEYKRREFLIAGALQAAPAFSAEDAILENASTRVVVRAGRIASLLDTTRSIEHVSARGDASYGLFRIQLVEGVRPVEEIDATAMTSRVTGRTANALEMEFEHARASARLRIVLGDAPGETDWTISVRPKGNSLAAGWVACPVIVTPIEAQGQEKQYLLPMFEGRLQPLRQTPRFRPYPADLFAQMIACLAPGGGFLMWTDDREGHVKAFGFENRQGNAAFAVRHLMPYEPGNEWQSPYRTRLSFCGEAWQDAADIYRAWVSKQAWSATALRDRKDVPEFLHHPPLCISTQIDKESLDDLPGRLAAWSKTLDTPVVYRPLGWEKYGNWVGIDYFPPSTGEKQFRDLNARLKEQGIVTAGFISGFRWTTKQEGARGQRNNGPLQRYFERQGGSRFCERTREGELLSFKAEGRDSYRVCRGSALGRGLLQKIARELFDLGVTVIHDDQDHGPYPGGIESCFDPSHGHPVPCGPWSTAVTRTAFREIRAEAARRGIKDFFLTKESCSELLNMDLHAYQARYFHEDSSPGLVPLAQYLYHEHIAAVFGWVTAQSQSLWELAAMMVYGQVPSLAFWNASAGRPDAVPAGAVTLLSDYYAAMKTYAKNYLLYGRMSRPLILNAPAVEKEISQVKDRKLAQKHVIRVPQVIQSAWRDGRGNVGVFAVNTLRQDAVVRVAPPGSGRWRAILYTGAARQNEQDVAPGGMLEWRLAPGRLGAIVFKPR